MSEGAGNTGAKDKRGGMMGSLAHRLEVQLLGQRMMLKTGGDAARIERLVSYVRRKIDESTPSGPIASSRLALLVALNIADDYFRLLDETREFRADVSARSKAVLADLDELRAGWDVPKESRDLVAEAPAKPAQGIRREVNTEIDIEQHTLIRN